MPDGRCALVAGGHRGTGILLYFGDDVIRLWDLGTSRCERSFEGQLDQVLAVACAPDGRFALSGSRDRTLKQWDLHTGG